MNVLRLLIEFKDDFSYGREKMNKVFIFDFDGTLVTEDTLDVICDIVGKKKESQALRDLVIHGKTKSLKPLNDRINFLKGVSYSQIKEKLNEKNYLQKGAKELFKYLKEEKFITVLSSGNILPVLRYYQELLGIDYIFGTNPKMKNDIIEGINLDNLEGKDFKYDACLDLINKLKISKENIYGIGDSAVDIKMLSLAGHTFAINPKGGLEQYVDYVIKNDLTEVINYL